MRTWVFHWTIPLQMRVYQTMMKWKWHIKPTCSAFPLVLTVPRLPSTSVPNTTTNRLHPLLHPDKTAWLDQDWHLSRPVMHMSWWRHQMETAYALLAFCVENSPVTGEFPAQRPVTRSFDMNKRLSKQSWGWRFETPSRSLWRHYNGGYNN